MIGWIKKYFKRQPTITFSNITEDISITIMSNGGVGGGGSDKAITIGLKKENIMKACKDCKAGKCKKHKK